MEVSELTVRLVVLLLPGVIAALIVETMIIHRVHRPTAQFRFLIYSIVLGLASYFLLSVVVWCWNSIASHCGLASVTLSVWDALFTENQIISITQVAFAILVSIPLALFVSLVIYKRWFLRVGHFFGVTNKYGSDSIYYYAIEKDEVFWVRIKALKHDVWYEGSVDSFSEDSDTREIFLRSVVVYRLKDSKKLYELSSVYLCLRKDEMIIEVPNTG